MHIISNNGHPELVLEENSDRLVFDQWCARLAAVDGVSMGKLLDDFDALWHDLTYKNVRFTLHIHDMIRDVVLLPLDDIPYAEAENLLKELAGNF